MKLPILYSALLLIGFGAVFASQRQQRTPQPRMTPIQVDYNFEARNGNATNEIIYYRYATNPAAGKLMDLTPMTAWLPLGKNEKLAFKVDRILIQFSAFSDGRNPSNLLFEPKRQIGPRSRGPRTCYIIVRIAHPDMLIMVTPQNISESARKAGQMISEQGLSLERNLTPDELKRIMLTNAQVAEHLAKIKPTEKGKPTQAVVPFQPSEITTEKIAKMSAQEKNKLLLTELEPIARNINYVSVVARPRLQSDAIRIINRYYPDTIPTGMNIDQIFKKLAEMFHPDKGGSKELFQAINNIFGEKIAPAPAPITPEQRPGAVIPAPTPAPLPLPEPAPAPAPAPVSGLEAQKRQHLLNDLNAIAEKISPEKAPQDIIKLRIEAEVIIGKYYPGTDLTFMLPKDILAKFSKQFENDPALVNTIERIWGALPGITGKQVGESEFK